MIHFFLKLNCFIAIFFLANQLVSAQEQALSSHEIAYDNYLAAKSSLTSSNQTKGIYAEALNHILRAEIILDGSNARLMLLKIKAFQGLGDNIAASMVLDSLKKIDLEPGTTLHNEVIQIKEEWKKWDPWPDIESLIKTGGGIDKLMHALKYVTSSSVQDIYIGPYSGYSNDLTNTTINKPCFEEYMLEYRSVHEARYDLRDLDLGYYWFYPKKGSEQKSRFKLQPTVYAIALDHNRWDIINALHEHGVSLLFLARYEGDGSIVRWNFGNCIFHALMMNQNENVKRLYDLLEDEPAFSKKYLVHPNIGTCNKKSLFLMYAVVAGNLQMTKYFLREGAGKNDSFLNIASVWGKRHTFEGTIMELSKKLRLSGERKEIYDYLKKN